MIARLAIVTGLAAAVLAAPLGLVPLLASGGSGIGTVAGCLLTDGDSIDGLDAEQSTNAATIVSVGQELGVPRYGLQIALATALQARGRLRRLYSQQPSYRASVRGNSS